MKTILALALAAFTFVNVNAYATEDAQPTYSSQSEEMSYLEEAGKPYDIISFLWNASKSLLLELGDTGYHGFWCAFSHVKNVGGKAGCWTKLERTAVEACWARVRTEAKANIAKYCGGSQSENAPLDPNAPIPPANEVGQ